MESLETRQLLAVTTLLNFPGYQPTAAETTAGLAPPDPVGDVGPNHYVQMTNTAGGSQFTVYSKTDGSVLLGPVTTSSLAQGGLCRYGLGDPIVQYDRFADRWMISEFADDGATDVGLCVYVSKTNDPTDNQWHAYSFKTQLFPDYPKYSVTPDAYFVTTNEQGTTQAPSVYALDRDNMLQGLPARPPQRFTAPQLPGFGFESLTPVYPGGTNAPPAGSPNLFMRHVDDELHYPTSADPNNDYLEIYAFRVDWNTPRNSRFQLQGRIPVAEFDSDYTPAGFALTVPQPGTNLLLDAIPEVIMYGLQYRNFGTYETIVGNFTVDAHANATLDDHSGIRWFELRKSGLSPWDLYQEGTLAPDAEHRWMGSIAMNGSGTIALGYSISSAITSPGIRVTGRLADDATGLMTQGEENMLNGQGYFDGNRWGDYSFMAVDPADDNTFWFTAEFANNGAWGTQIIAFTIEPDQEPPIPPTPPGELTVTGTKWHDLDRNGRRDTNEPPIKDIWIFADFDGDGRLDLGEPKAQTAADGTYRLLLDRVGTYELREQIPAGWRQTFPGGTDLAHEVTVGPGKTLGTYNFGNAKADDLGDAPINWTVDGTTVSYPTLLKDNGPSHPILPGFSLGSNVDGEADGIPSLTATGDDADQVPDDEDGVRFRTNLIPGQLASVDVTVTTSGNSPGRLNGWIDFNRNGAFELSEKIISDERVGDFSNNPLVKTFNFTVPATAKAGATFARFRYGYTRNQGPTGPDIAGEVEDHRVEVLGTTPIARPDVYADLSNTTHTLPVLINDIPSQAGGLRITKVTSGSAGGTTRISADGRTVIYTPRNASFAGTETFQYTIADQAGNTGPESTAGVTVTVLSSIDAPQAIDDSASFTSSDLSLEIDVLQNDISGKFPPISIASWTQPVLGSGTVDLDDKSTSDPTDDRIVFTRVAGQTDPAQFQYTIEDSNGATSTATVTVHMPNDQVGDVVQYRIEARDLGGLPLANGALIAVGQEFDLVVFAKDLRTDDGTPPATDNLGLFAAFLDVLYNANLVSRVGDVQISGTFDGPPTFPPGLDLDGILNEVGGTQDPGDVESQPVNQETELFRVRMRADAPGEANFIGDPADETSEAGVAPLHDTLLISRAIAPPPGTFDPNVVLLKEIRFTNTSLKIGASATDDYFEVAAGSGFTFLDVLKNDLGNPNLVVKSFGDFTDVGQAQIVDGKLYYKPGATFVGTEQFTYTVENSITGVTAFATVTVKVGNVPANLLLAGFSFQIRDQNGNAIAPLPSGEVPLTIGQEFQLRVYVSDLRPTDPVPATPADDRGIYAAWLDVLYDSSLVSTIDATPTVQQPFDFRVDFGQIGTPDVNPPDDTYINGRSGSVSDLKPNLIDELGAFQASDEPLGAGQRLLATVTMVATGQGSVTFQADPADLVGTQNGRLHDLLLFEPPDPPVNGLGFGDSWDLVSFGSTKVLIGSGASSEGELTYTNPVNPLDVNGDSFVSPIDVLLVVNVTNTLGPGKLPSPTTGLGEGELTKGRGGFFGYVDVNGDGYLTAIDTVSIVNYLNRPKVRVASGEGEAAAASESSLAPTSQIASLAAATTSTVDPLRSVAVPTRVTTAASESATATASAYHAAEDTDAAITDWAVRSEPVDPQVADDLAEELAQFWSGLIRSR